ncbi:MAG: tetraacyldisaccharide 4'-kinase [Burkholderiaceae bacterium]
MSPHQTSIESTLMRAWLRRGLLAWVLWPLSLIFGLIVKLRRCLFQLGWLPSTRVRVPVIVVGNIFIGGTGKTPLVIWLVQAMRRAGYTPGVISRGYGVQNEVPREVLSDSLSRDVGDEPVLIANHAVCPVMVGRNRVAAANALLAAHPEVNLIISDDGLQHYALQRDVEIVLFDARGIGNGWMLPAGPLREPKKRRADFTVVHAAKFPSELPAKAIRMQLMGDVAERLADRSQRIALTDIMDSVVIKQPVRIVAAAGIGNPARFFTLLHSAGLVFHEMPLPDHYDFAINPFAGLSADIILITEKDAVKCIQVEDLRNDPRLWVVPVTARIDGALAEQIVEKLRGRPTA